MTYCVCFWNNGIRLYKGSQNFGECVGFSTIYENVCTRSTTAVSGKSFGNADDILGEEHVCKGCPISLEPPPKCPSKICTVVALGGGLKTYGTPFSGDTSNCYSRECVNRQCWLGSCVVWRSCSFSVDHSTQDMRFPRSIFHCPGQCWFQYAELFQNKLTNWKCEPRCTNESLSDARNKGGCLRGGGVSVELYWYQN